MRDKSTTYHTFWVDSIALEQIERIKREVPMWVSLPAAVRWSLMVAGETLDLAQAEGTPVEKVRDTIPGGEARKVLLDAKSRATAERISAEVPGASGVSGAIRWALSVAVATLDAAETTGEAVRLGKGARRPKTPPRVTPQTPRDRE